MWRSRKSMWSLRSVCCEGKEAALCGAAGGWNSAGHHTLPVQEERAQTQGTCHPPQQPQCRPLWDLVQEPQRDPQRYVHTPKLLNIHHTLKLQGHKSNIRHFRITLSWSFSEFYDMQTLTWSTFAKLYCVCWHLLNKVSPTHESDTITLYLNLVSVAF